MTCSLTHCLNGKDKESKWCPYHKGIVNDGSSNTKAMQRQTVQADDTAQERLLRDTQEPSVEEEAKQEDARQEVDADKGKSAKKRQGAMRNV